MNLDRFENKKPEISRFPEDRPASATVAFNPGRHLPDEGLSKTEKGEFLGDVIIRNKKDMLGFEKILNIKGDGTVLICQH